VHNIVAKGTQLVGQTGREIDIDEEPQAGLGKSGSSRSRTAALEVREVGEDFVSGHPVGDHGHHRGHWDTEPSDARHPAHDGGVHGNAREGHDTQPMPFVR
jgi:hypothetical protein